MPVVSYNELPSAGPQSDATVLVSSGERVTVEPLLEVLSYKEYPKAHVIASINTSYKDSSTTGYADFRDCTITLDLKYLLRMPEYSDLRTNASYKVCLIAGGKYYGHRARSKGNAFTLPVRARKWSLLKYNKEPAVLPYKSKCMWDLPGYIKSPGIIDINFIPTFSTLPIITVSAINLTGRNTLESGCWGFAIYKDTGILTDRNFGLVRISDVSLFRIGKAHATAIQVGRGLTTTKGYRGRTINSMGCIMEATGI